MGPCQMLLQVVSNLELINCQVIRWVTDGASKNVTSMRNLLGKGAGRTPHSIEWLDTTYMSCVHPVDRGRRVFFWLCSTH
jgi:hypothetical protein